MLLFKSNFGKDIVILLVVTIILSAVLSLVIGVISDYYFGDAVNSLIGDYKNNDLLLIIDKNSKEETLERVEEVLTTKLPGSNVKTGINLAGKSNLFIELAEKYRTRDVFLKLEDQFNKIKGVLTTSLMTEPRLTIEGLKNKSKQLLAEKINQLEHVAFTFPDGGSLEVIISDAQFTAQVKAEINDILDNYQMLGVRFPIEEEVDNLVELSAKVKTEVEKDYAETIHNLTEVNSNELGDLVTTMTEMKEFLSSYAAAIKIKLFAGQEVSKGDRLLIPAVDNQKIHLRVSNVNDMIATAVITTGDSSNLIGDTVYRDDGGSETQAVGELEVDNPRQRLSYLVTELNKLVPQLNYLFTDANSLLTKLEETTASLEVLEGTTAEVTALNSKLTGYTQDLKSVDSQTLKSDLHTLEQQLQQLVFVIEKLEFVRDLIIDLTAKLENISSDIANTKQEFKAGSIYYNNLTELEQNIGQLNTAITGHTTEIISYINRYNPLLQEIKSWQQNVQDFNLVIDKFIKEPPAQFTKKLATLTNEDVTSRLTQLTALQTAGKLAAVKKQLAAVKKIDFAGITAKLEYIEQSLPKLKDEEITASIDLLDHYLAGKAIPGEEISLLLPEKITKLTEIKAKIKELTPQQVSFYTSPMGVVVPNLRSQIYQILSEVKILLTAVTAVLCTILSLLFDHSLIITSLQELNKNNKWYHNPAFYYSLMVGVITLGSIIYLTKLKSPYLPWWSSLMIGMGLGIMIFKKAAAINDFAASEFKAGEAFGFNYGQIMRQIIIPAAKPGLLKLLNQRQTYF